MIKITAGFWIRFLSGIIDSFVFLVFAYLLSIPMVNQDLEIIGWYYYTWFFEIAISIIIFQTLVPMTNKSRMTLGRWICRLEIVGLDDSIPNYKVIVKKEILYSLLWIFCFILFILFISPELFTKIAKSSHIQIRDNKNFSNFEIFLVSLPTSLITFLNFFQIAITLSLMKKSRISFNDYFSKTKTVWKNKYTQKITEKQLHSIPRKLPELEWLN